MGEARRAAHRPRSAAGEPAVRAAELQRLFFMVVLLVGALAVFLAISEALTEPPPAPARPADAPAAGEQEALTREQAERMQRLERALAEARRAHGLPEPEPYLPAGVAEPTATAEPVAGEPIPLDHGLLQWVEDGTEERESAPLHHLMRYVLSRTREQLLAEVDPDRTLPRTRLIKDAYDPEEAARVIEFVRTHRGSVFSVKGHLLDMYPRAVPHPRSPVPLVYEAYVADKNQQVWLVIALDKVQELQPGKDLVHAVGPLFKLLKVETRDPDPNKRYKGFPVIISPPLTRIEPPPVQPPSWRQNPIGLIGVAAFAIVLALVVGHYLWQRRRPPPPPRPRRALDNDRLRQLDRTRRLAGGAQDRGTAPEAAVAGPPVPAAGGAAGSEAPGAAPPGGATQEREAGSSAHELPPPPG
ncbi:MAG: hypothetical protein KatS3mg102_2565 [Planctomycetota bacterium]|nr:MAG: hypothetical protein KatS3mg102_2565 [Planctomycetota bacterium]